MESTLPRGMRNSSVHAGTPIPDAFFNRCADEVAANLIGCFLFVDHEEDRVGGQIIETEAYCQSDPSAHCHNDKRTAQGELARRRQAKWFDSMYLPWAHVYIYDHFCLNFVCGAAGFGSAVLIRSLKPTCGISKMFDRRTKPKNKTPGDETYLCSGPINLCEALQINRDNYDGRPISKTRLRLYRPATSVSVVCGPRVLGKLAEASPSKVAESWHRSYISADKEATKFLSPGAQRLKHQVAYSADHLHQLRREWLSRCDCSYLLER